MVKWKIMCKPKDMGGLGILDTTTMNTSPLFKWLWKLLTTGPETLWLSILKAKYSLRSKLLVAQMDVSNTILVLDTSI